MDGIVDALRVKKAVATLNPAGDLTSRVFPKGRDVADCSGKEGVCPGFPVSRKP
ncbi:hypothetical protein [Oxalobacter paraformigenes]|uniref:hypothetical protein n=1 Tax=Oxalobacter paraformigenes TaxID=556268 RepID=UPI00031BDDD6|nr:hypothetical protein [Oxalobacter paraformigenes]